jgi:hypothetical protein
MLFTVGGGVPDFSAISRSCSSMTARAGGVAIRTTEDSAWYSAIGALRAVFVEHVE